jgi:hypothetical protein
MAPRRGDSDAAVELCPICDRQGYLNRIDLPRGTKHMVCRACRMTWRVPIKSTEGGSSATASNQRWTLSAVAQRAAGSQPDPDVPSPPEPEWLLRIRAAVRTGARSVRPGDLKRLLHERDHLLARADPNTASEVAAFESADTEV